MKLSQYKFNLPPELVAKFPAKNRDESRMMVLHRDTGKIEHRIFRDIIDYFEDHDVMVFNDTKVFPARLYGNKEKTGAEIEVFLLRELNREQRLWDVLVDPARKIRIGNKLYFGEDDILVAEVIDSLSEKTLAVQQANSDKRYRQVAGSLAVVAGENTQTAGINRQAFMKAEFRAKVGDQVGFRIQTIEKRFLRCFFVSVVNG